MKKYIKLCIAAIINYLFWRGVYDNIIDVLPNACEMTYMYEYPEYVEVVVSNNNLNRYKLYVYGEGHYARLLKKKVFKGIPVLFIPGNQGSSKQIRSLASVAYRMFQSSSSQFHFNYFAVDFNEEIGALFGPVLDRQTRFVSLAIKTILNLYQKRTKKPQSVILIGHSMGGLVARAVVSLPDIPSDLVSIIITEATPHARPVVALDSSLLAFSESTNAYWERERNFKLKNIVFVTIGGGKSDIQVPSVLTTSHFADIDETLLSVPSCWLTTDHLAIVWCRQLVLAINRALFNSVDKSTLQVSTDISRIIRAFESQLSQRADEKVTFQTIKQRIGSNGIKPSDLFEIKHLPFAKRLRKPFKELFFVVPLSENVQGRLLTIVFGHVGPRSFLMACNVVSNTSGSGGGNLVVNSGEDLGHYARSVPGNRKEVNIELSTLDSKNYSHVVALVQATSEQATIALDISDTSLHSATIVAPTFLSSFSAIPIMEEFPKRSLTLNITLEGFTEFWQAFTLRLIPIGDCAAGGDQPVVSLRSSWINRWEYVTCRNIDSLECDLGLDVPSPLEGEGDVEIHIVKPPVCSYTLSLQKNLRGIFERIALLFVAQIPTFVVCQLLLILANQYKAVATGGQTSFYSHFANLSPVSLIPLMKLLALGISKFSDLETDKAYLEKSRTNIEVLPIVLFVAALPVTLLFSSSLEILLSGLAYAFRWTPRSRPKCDTVKSNLSSVFLSASSFSTVMLVAVGASTCGALALSAASCVYFMKVLKMNMNKHAGINSSGESCNAASSKASYNEDRELTPSGSIDDNVQPSSDHNSTVGNESIFEQNLVDGDTSPSIETASEKTGPEEKHTDLEELSPNIHFTLMTLVFAISLLNFPSLIAWIKNLGFEHQLSCDPCLKANFCVLGSLFVLWQIHIFNPTKKFYSAVGYALHLSCTLIILFGTVRLFKVSEIVSNAFMMIALHQLLASSM